MTIQIMMNTKKRVWCKSIACLLLLITSFLCVHAQEPLHLNSYQDFCELNSDGTQLTVSNYRSNILNKKYELTEHKGPHHTCYYFKQESQRNEFLEQIGFTQKVLDSNEFYKSAKYLFYDTSAKKEITDIAEKMVNRLMQPELKGKMIIVGVPNEVIGDDDNLSSEQAKTLTKASNSKLNIYLFGLIGLLLMGIGCLLYDKLKNKVPAVENLQPQLIVNSNSSTLEVTAKEIHSSIENKELKLQFQNFYEQIKLKLQEKEKLGIQTEQQLKAQLEDNEKALSDLVQQLDTLRMKVQQDNLYAEKLYQKIIQPFLSYFDLHQDYPVQESSKKVFISSLLQISFHAISYIHSKRESADQFDLINIQEILHPETIQKNLLVKTSNKPVFGDVPVFIHYICDLLAEYNIDQLDHVNIKSYLITRQS